MSDRADPSPSPSASTSAVGSSADSHIDYNAPAVVSWCSDDDGLRHMDDVTFEITWDAAQNAAFFKIRCTVLFKDLTPPKTALFLFLHPERIQSLTLEETSPDPRLQVASEKLGSRTACLHFSLAAPADLIGPSAKSLRPKNRVSGDVLDSMRSLADEVRFAVHLSQGGLGKSRLQALCRAISVGSVKSMPRQADIARLYHGNGGRVVSDFPAPNRAAPPSYGEVEPDPPSTLETFKGDMSKKRRRTSSSDGGRHTFDSLQVESICRKLLDAQKAEMLKIMEDRDHRLYDRLVSSLRPSLSHELRSLEARIMKRVDQRLGEYTKEQDVAQDRSLSALQNDITQEIIDRVEEVDNKVEDEFYGLRLRMEEYINHEMTQVEERIMGDIESRARISLEFVG